MVTDQAVSPEGVRYRDLNGNGVMDPYENPRLPIEARVADLLGRMTVEEKAGLMVQPAVQTNQVGGLIEDEGLFWYGTTNLIVDKFINHMSVLQLPDPHLAARWNNRIQELAAQTRLGIPVTIFSDPRNAFSDNIGAAIASGSFSQWPEAIGFGAIGDPALVQEYADAVRQEYLAVGIRGATHPQLDLATEPRWARQFQGFGESAKMTAELAEAYIRGFQGDALGPESVACMAKHFPGGGSQKDGEDPHFPYGREQVYPGNNFEYHLLPFLKAIEAGVASMMPYYGMPVGLTLQNGTVIEEQGFAFNRSIITGLLREELGFDGVVCTDYTIISDVQVDGRPFPARAWGVEHLSPIDRVAAVLEAGCDQLGGEACTELIVELVRRGKIAEERLNQSVRRLLRVKFELGLFEDPYVNEDAATSIVGRPEFVRAGLAAQKRSLTLLLNSADQMQKPTLPLSKGSRIFAPEIHPETISKYAIPAVRPQDADITVIRLKAPYEPRDTYFLESKFHAGGLDFDLDTVAQVAELAQHGPVVTDIYLDRPAIIGPLADHSAALVVNYGCSDEALLDVLFGNADPEGRLPFEIPSSIQAVEASRPDVPSDTRDPLFPAGHGLSYDNFTATIQEGNTKLS